MSIPRYAEQPLEDIVVSADGAIFNNAAQMWNHEFFFDELSPKAQTRPTGALLKAIDQKLRIVRSAERPRVEKAAAGLFGSGWVWLAEDKSGKLAIVSEQNAGNPLALRHEAPDVLRRFGSMLTISTTATAAPMPSQPSGTASTGRSSKSATPRE